MDHRQLRIAARQLPLHGVGQMGAGIAQQWTTANLYAGRHGAINRDKEQGSERDAGSACLRLPEARTVSYEPCARRGGYGAPSS